MKSPILGIWLHLQNMKNNKPKVKQIWNNAICPCLISNVSKMLSLKIWLPVVSCRVIFILQSQPSCGLCRHTWASFKLTSGATSSDAVAAAWSPAWAALSSLGAASSTHWAPCYYGCFISSASARHQLGLSVQAAVATLEYGHVCAVATDSQLPILNDCRDPHWLQRFTDSFQ